MPELHCRVRLPWWEEDVTVNLPQGADVRALRAALEPRLKGAEVFCFDGSKMLLEGKAIEQDGEVLILPVLSGG